MTSTLYQLKPQFQALLRPLVGRLAGAGVRPNQVTAGAVAVSAVAGLAVAAGSTARALLWLVPALYLLRMALNATDGLLAREHHGATASGAVFNEIADVLSDALAYLPFALVFPAQAPVVVFVVVLALISEVAALAAATDTGRNNCGPLGKSDRALAFGALAIAAALGFAWAGWAVWALGAAAALTIANRARVET